MKTFTFVQKNGSVTITLSENNLEDAKIEVVNLIGTDNFEDFRIENEDGDSFTWE